MDPFHGSRLAQTIYAERIEHTFQPLHEQPPVTSSSGPDFGRWRRAPIATAWRHLLASLALRPRLAGHRS